MKRTNWIAIKIKKAKTHYHLLINSHYLLVQKPSPIIQNPSHSENRRKILIAENNICKTNEKSSSAAESQVKEEENNKNSIITTDIQQRLFYLNI